MKWNRVLTIVNWLMFTFIAVVLFHYGRRVFVGDWFPVNTPSMVPTIIPGDKIWVNKLIFGARIYKNLDFLDGKPLETFRIKGWRKIRRGDVVVFNAPIQPNIPDSIVFKINHVYVKRCVGVPGDTLRLSGPATAAAIESATAAAIVGRASGDSLQRRKNQQKYSGTVYIPGKGDTLFMNDPNIELYLTVIGYERKGDASVDYHVFQNNYYFTCGDNTRSSHDSRYFGFVPEEFIIGVSKRVLFNNRDGWKQKFEGRRILKQMSQMK